MAANIMIPTAGELTLGSPPTDFACQIVSAMLDDEAADTTVETYCGYSTDAGQERLVLTLDYLQDWHATGISKYLWDHRGQDVPFEFTPAVDGTPSVAGTLTITRRPSFGGVGGQPARATQRLAVVGGVILTADA